jgi:hypothetical protein
MVLSKKSIAQGTIEYLVIIAVVVVISLIIVSLFITIFDSPSQEITDSSSKTGNVAIGGISIVESVIDPAGDSLIRLSNNSSDAITLTKINVGGVDNNFSEQLVGLDSKVFSLSSLNSSCPCASGQKSVKCEVKIIYTTATGVEKTEYRTINTQCVNNSTPVNEDTVVNPIVPVLELGTLANPWIINNCLELQDMNLHLDGNYVLGNDINCYETKTWGYEGFVPIGPELRESELIYFTGSFDGKGHIIENLDMNAGYYGGLFGATEYAVLKNFGLENAEIICTTDELMGCGGIVGDFSGVMDNVYFTGKVDAILEYTSNLGGLVGATSRMGFGNEPSQIINSYSIGEFTGTYNVGGLVGYSEDVSILNSYSNGRVLGSGAVGGLIGSSNYDSVSGCYFSGDVNGASSVGGLIGSSTLSIISNSYSNNSSVSESVSGNYNVGGLVGYFADGSRVLNSYSTSDVLGYDYVGGLVGNSDFSFVFNSYSAGKVSVKGGSPSYIGGLIGTNGVTITNSYWDINKSGRSYCCNLGSCTNCLGKNISNSEPDAFYPKSALGGDYNVPMQHNIISSNDWTFGEDGNWIVQVDNYPILSWQ